jgi:hypothetical protein
VPGGRRPTWVAVLAGRSQARDRPAPNARRGDPGQMAGSHRALGPGRTGGSRRAFGPGPMGGSHLDVDRAGAHRALGPAEARRHDPAGRSMGRAGPVADRLPMAGRPAAPAANHRDAVQPGGIRWAVVRRAADRTAEVPMGGRRGDLVRHRGVTRGMAGRRPMVAGGRTVGEARRSVGAARRTVRDRRVGAACRSGAGRRAAGQRRIAGGRTMAEGRVRALQGAVGQPLGRGRYRDRAWRPGRDHPRLAAADRRRASAGQPRPLSTRRRQR